MYLIEFDEYKNASNFLKHGMYLSEATYFEWDTAVCWGDRRFDYNEDRQVCIGYIGNRLHVIVYVMRWGVCRVISLRRANLREIKKYAES